MMKLVDYFVIVGYVDEESDEEKNAEFDDNDDDNDDNNCSSNGGAVIVVDDEGLVVSNVESEVKLKRHQKKVNSIGKAKIIQRFPLSIETSVDKKRCQSQEKDDDDGNSDENRDCSMNDEQQEFDENIHCFCQPHKGWRLYAKQEAPTFFVSVLTDIKGKFRIEYF